MPPIASPIRCSSRLLLLCAAGLAACDAAAEGVAGAAVVRDSAGVQIVENVDSGWEAGAEWRVPPEPQLQIGMAEGSQPYLLDRVTGVRRLSDGRVVVANGGSSELRYFGADGAHLKSVGGPGAGPGEYRAISLLSRYPGDSLFVFDQGARRAAVLSAEGEHGRVVSFPAVGEGGTPHPLGTFEDGTILGRLTVLIGADEVRTGMQQSKGMYARLSGSDGTLLDSIVVITGEERHLATEGDMLMITSPLIGPQPHVAASGNTLFAGYGGEFEIRVVDHDGTLRRVIRRSGDPARLSDAELARLLEERLAEIELDEVRRRLRDIYGSMPAPEVRPAFTGLMADDAGNLWVQEANLPWEPALWTVFGTDGVQLGPVEIPIGFHPMHIGEDFMLGVSSDDLGVERVKMYAIEKG